MGKVFGKIQVAEREHQFDLHRGREANEAIQKNGKWSEDREITEITLSDGHVRIQILSTLSDQKLMHTSLG